jgi:hypothetical protein
MSKCHSCLLPYAILAVNPLAQSIGEMQAWIKEGEITGHNQARDREIGLLNNLAPMRRKTDVDRAAAMNQSSIQLSKTSRYHLLPLQP